MKDLIRVNGDEWLLGISKTLRREGCKKTDEERLPHSLDFQGSGSLTSEIKCSIPPRRENLLPG